MFLSNYPVPTMAAREGDSLLHCDGDWRVLLRSLPSSRLVSVEVEEFGR